MTVSRVAATACLAAGVVATALVAPVFTQGARPAARPVWPPRLQAPAAGEVEVLPVQGNVHVIIGAGGNIAVQHGEQGVLVVDTGTAAMSDKVIAAIQGLAKGRPMRFGRVTPDQL